MRKNCPSDRDFFLKFEAEDEEFSKHSRPLEQFIQTRSEQFLVTECLFLEVSQINKLEQLKLNMEKIIGI